MADPNPTPAQVYAERAARFAAARDAVAARWSRVANWRLVALLAAAACLGVGWWRGPGWLIWAGVGLAGAFLALVAHHNRLAAERRRYAALHDISQEGLARLRRDWSALPLRAPANPPAAELELAPFAVDIDLLGPASLQHLLGTPRTPVGLATLQRWLLAPAPPPTVRERQAAVAELAPQIELRDRLALAALRAEGQERSYLDFTAWAAGEPWLLRRPILRWIARLSSALFLVGAVAQIAGLTALPLWGVPLILNMLLTLFGRRTLDTTGRLLDRQDLLAAYSELFAVAANTDLRAGELRRLQAALSADGLRADVQLRRIGRVAVLAEYTRSILAPILQLGLLWSFHVADLAERWQRDAGPRLGPWLVALGELEALAALAALRYDHPAWSFPEIVEDGPAQVQARGLGHPLLPPERCVPNDLQIGPPGRFLLVTGSNMAGKSTLLRAAGLNIVLAQIGGPVCAAEMRLPPLSLATSMRVQDSLAQGVSYFMAELRRLKLVVERAEAARASGGPACCYLLDEILHGTNSAERQVAARRVIRYLVELGAIGAVSTHDLALADDPAIAGAAELVHFAEQFAGDADGAEMRFDYTLRPGLAPTTNALRLMALVGLPTADPPGTGVKPVPSGGSHEG